MIRNMNNYYTAWELRQQGKKLREIGYIMGFKTGERARQMISYIDFRIKCKFPSPSKDLVELAKKYNKF